MLQEFVQQVKNTVRKELETVHTAIPGKITDFDASTGLATVTPLMKFKRQDGSSISYPAISGVPVVIPQAYGQSATIAFPVKKGDGCLLLVAEQSLDYFMYGQETSIDLQFDLSNAVCIPGLFSKANSVLKDACNANAVIVDVKGSRIKVASGVVQIDATRIALNGNVTVNGSSI